MDLTLDLNSLDFLLGIIIGNGALIAIIGFLFQRQQELSARDFEARKEAKTYYRTIYGHIAVLSDLAHSYVSCLNQTDLEVADYSAGKLCTVKGETLLTDYRKNFESFEKYYLNSKKEGYEVFVSKKLKHLLINFWSSSRDFYKHPDRLSNKESVDNYCEIANKTTDYMEKLFGLKTIII
jgi:hypothetical protein